MANYVDLHCHSTASDGTLAPTAVVRLARRSGLCGLSLTDHDTIGGLAEAAAEASRLGLMFLPGIEISCTFARPGTLHLLGYGIDPQSAALAEMTAKLRAAREQRNAKMIELLNGVGIGITTADVLATAPAGEAAVLGRPHIAMAMIRKGYVNTISEAFGTYLGQGARAWVDKEQITPAEAIETITRSGGLAVLAHPVQLRRPNEAELATVVKSLVDVGLAGIEVIHSDHNAGTIAMLGKMADRWKLLKTGGSDFHGGSKAGVRLGYAGKRRIGREMMDALAARLGRSLGAAAAGV